AAEAAEPAEARTAGALRPAEAIEIRALRRVVEDVVGVLDLLELLLGLLVAGVLVGVELLGQLAVRLGDLVRRRGRGDAEDFVRVAGHGSFLGLRQLLSSFYARKNRLRFSASWKAPNRKRFQVFPRKITRPRKAAEP